MPVKIANSDLGIKVFNNPPKIVRAICTRCAWKYDGEGVHELLIMSHAAGHSYKGDHEIRFETAEQAADADRLIAEKKFDELDDDDVDDVEEFSETTAGYRARDRWARRYDDLNGAPEGDGDR